jgi:probable F420-dependent oxidoreductase
VHLGIVVLPTDRSAPVDTLAVAAEERGLESLFVGDHTHIPASRASPSPLGGDLADEYCRIHDPFVVLATAAARTERLRLGTAVYLVAQRDPISTAKQVASLDFVSHGRFVFGVGNGWNAEEAANHGVEFATRRARIREYVLAMRALWTDDEASYQGEFVAFDRVWMWPKPVTRPHPPVLLGAGPGPRNFGAIVEMFDGWLPVPFFGHVPAHVAALRRLADEHGRDPRTLSIHVNGALAEPRSLDPWAEVGAERALVPLPSAPLDAVLPLLDQAAALVADYA